MDKAKRKVVFNCFSYASAFILGFISQQFTHSLLKSMIIVILAVAMGYFSSRGESG